MKNINVSLKMVVCFSLMIILTVTICVLGVLGLRKLDEETQAFYEEIVVAIEHIGRIRENFQEQRVLIQELTLVESEVERAQIVIKSIQENQKEMDGYLKLYESTILNKDHIHNVEILSEENAYSYNIFSENYYSYFEPELNRIVNSVGEINHTRVDAFISSAKATTMSQMLTAGYDFYTGLSRGNAAEAHDLYQRNSTVIIITTVISTLISLFFVIYLPVTIARPLRRMVKVADDIAEGDMTLQLETVNRGDEVGRLANAFARMHGEIGKQVGILEALSNGDLTVEPELRSEKDVFGKALEKLATNLGHTISDVTNAADGVARESSNVATQSQELAQGTTEQAASVEQLSSAFFEISLNTKESATLASKAATLADEVKQQAIDGEDMMKQLIQAVKEADVASRNIDKIIKVIEEISFQTNILALNAAVEAAHAGQNGSGFAVVAAEVRSLASKSASSAKETSELIANASEKVQLGAEYASQTSSAFHKIVDGVIESTKLIGDIAKSSEEQALAIEQINTGIGQVAQVIHINSEAAEKCAAAAEKMNTQAQTLEHSIARFKTQPSKAAAPQEAPAAPLSFAKPVVEEPLTIDLHPTIPNDDFGKY